VGTGGVCKADVPFMQLSQHFFLLYTAKIKNPPESHDICGKITKKREKDLTF
jgi:hypothetical protein